MESVGRFLGFLVFLFVVGLVKLNMHDSRQHYSAPPPAYQAPAQQSVFDRVALPEMRREDPYPQTRYTYDATSGNSYRTVTYGDGRTEVYGSNARTGSMWTSYVESNGNQHGFDADGQPWSCVGTGAAQVCN